MRRCELPSPVSPKCWGDGRPQRARHMSAIVFGTVMSPSPRGVLLKQRSKGYPARCGVVHHQSLMARAVEDLSSDRCTMVRIKAAVTEMGWRAAKWRLVSRRRCTSPESFPIPCCLLPPSHRLCIVFHLDYAREPLSRSTPRYFLLSSPFRPWLMICRSPRPPCPRRD